MAAGVERLLVHTCCLPLLASACSVEPALEAPSRLQVLASQIAVPDGGEFLVSLTDFERGFEQFDFDLASSCSSERYVDRLFQIDREVGLAGPEFLSLMFRDPDDLANSFGIEWCDIQAAADAGFASGTYLVVETDPVDIADIVETEPVWSSQLRTESTDTGVLYDWGSDIDTERISGVRPLGRGGQLHVSDNVVVRSAAPEAMDAFLDASAQQVSDIDCATEAIGYLERQGAFSIAVTNIADTPDLFDVLNKGDLDGFDGGLLRWDVLGLGARLDESGTQRLDVVVSHRSEADADENLARLRDLVATGTNPAETISWSEVYRIDSSEVVGTQVQMTLSNAIEDRPLMRLTLNWILARVSLFAVEL